MKSLSLFILAALMGSLGVYVGILAIRLRLLSLLVIAAVIFFMCAALIRAGIGFTN